MPTVATADADRLHMGERLIHPYAALALVLSLSGSPTWAMDNDDGTPHGEYSVEPGGDNAPAAAASAKVTKERVGRHDSDGGANGEVVDLIDDSSKLWSTDSEEEEEAETGAEGGGGSVGVVRRTPLQGGGHPSSVQDNASSDGEREGETTTEEWLQAFQNERDEGGTSDEGNACTDGEFCKDALRIPENYEACVVLRVFNVAGGVCWPCELLVRSPRIYVLLQ